MTDAVITGRDEVVAALHDPALIPPGRPGDGAALALRAAMARFSGPADHPVRRGEVEEALAALDAQAVAAVAASRTAARLRGAGEVDAVGDLARTVPTEALALSLSAATPHAGAGPDAAEPADMVAEVAAMVEVIGHGAASTPQADAAVARLVRRFGVAGASLLYQNHDATAALIATRLAASTARQEAVPAVPRTVRTAPDGSTVTLEIGAAGLPFGAGPHRCPGEELAEAICGAVLGAIAASGRTVDLGHAAFDADGRPTALPLVRR